MPKREAKSLIQISFIIPAFERSILLQKTLVSILKDKTLTKEIIVIDDASKTPLSNIFSNKFPAVKFIRLDKNSGPGAARNIGLSKAKGDYICFLDSDDLLSKNFCSMMLEHSKKYRLPVLCLSQAILPDNLNSTEKLTYYLINWLRNMTLIYLYLFNDKKLSQEAFFGAALSRMIFPRKNIYKLKFDTSMRSCEDWHFLIRLMKNTSVIILPKKLVGYRFSRNSLTHTGKKEVGWSAYDAVVQMLPQNLQKTFFIRSFKLYKNIFSHIL